MISPTKGGIQAGNWCCAWTIHPINRFYRPNTQDPDSFRLNSPSQFPPPTNPTGVVAASVAGRIDRSRRAQQAAVRSGDASDRAAVASPNPDRSHT